MLTCEYNENLGKLATFAGRKTNSEVGYLEAGKDGHILGYTCTDLSCRFNVVWRYYPYNDEWDLCKFVEHDDCKTTLKKRSPHSCYKPKIFFKHVLVNSPPDEVPKPKALSGMLQRFLRRTPPTSFFRKLQVLVKTELHGKAEQEVAELPDFIRLLNNAGHYATFESIGATEMKSVIIKRAKYEHNILQKSLPDDEKKAFDEQKVSLLNVVEGRRYLSRIFVSTAASRLMLPLLSDVTTADGAHCKIGTVLTTNGRDANRHIINIAWTWCAGGENLHFMYILC